MSVRVIEGDVRLMLPLLETGSVQMCVTSPPYFQLRDYGVDGQVGLEETVEEYIDTLVAVFAEVKRVLRDDGCLFLNLGDSYMANRGNGTGNPGYDNKASRRVNYHYLGKKPAGDLKTKDLIGIPWMVAFALRADGWYLRSEITWCKKAPMPESVTDRPTSATEKIFLLTKSARYFYDAIAVAEESVADHGSGNGYKRQARLSYDGRGSDTPYEPAPTRNMRNYWLLGPEPFPAAHFAVFPTEIPRRAILAGTSEKGACSVCGAPWVRVVEREFMPTQNPAFPKGGTKGMDASNGWGDVPRGRVNAETTGWQPTCTHDAPIVPCMVLDPFAGAGTTGLVADRLGRDAVLVELSPEYAEMARKRIRGDAPMFADVL